MAPPGVVMRPVNDGNAAGIVHHLAAHLYPVAGLHGNARSNPYVVNDFDGPGCGLRAKDFVHTFGACAEKETWVRGDACLERNFGRTRAGIGGLQVHAYRSRPFVVG